MNNVAEACGVEAGIMQGPLAVESSLVEGLPETPCARPETAVPTRIFDRASLGAGGLYIALSIIFLGRRLISDFAGSYVGRYADPSLFIWSIAWWPYALSHRLNPIVTHAIYAPVGATCPNPRAQWIDGVYSY